MIFSEPNQVAQFPRGIFVYGRFSGGIFGYGRFPGDVFGYGRFPGGVFDFYVMYLIMFIYIH